MAQYRKKPVVIEAIKWTGNNVDEMVVFVTDNFVSVGGDEDGTAYISTLECTMEASPGDWIIKGVNGEFYPCKPDIFEKTYELV